VSSDFFSGVLWNSTAWAEWVNDIAGEKPADLSHLPSLQAHPSEVNKIDNAECIKAYGREFVLDSGTLFMVTNIPSPGDAIFAITDYETLGDPGSVTSG
jgi:hypothetical protein